MMTAVGGKPVYLNPAYAKTLGTQPVGWQYEDDYEPWGVYKPEFDGGGD